MIASTEFSPGHRSFVASPRRTIAEPEGGSLSIDVAIDLTDLANPAKTSNSFVSRVRCGLLCEMSLANDAPPDLVMIVRLSAKRNALAIGPRLCCSTIASFRSCARWDCANQYRTNFVVSKSPSNQSLTAISDRESKRHRRAQRLTHVVNDWRRLVCSIPSLSGSRVDLCRAQWL